MPLDKGKWEQCSLSLPPKAPFAEGVRPLLQADLGQEELACSSCPAGSKAQAGGLFMLPLTRPAAQSRIADKTSEQRFSQLS